MLDAQTAPENQILVQQADRNLDAKAKLSPMAQFLSRLTASFWSCSETASKSTHKSYNGIL